MIWILLSQWGKLKEGNILILEFNKFCEKFLGAGVKKFFLTYDRREALARVRLSPLPGVVSLGACVTLVRLQRSLQLGRQIFELKREVLCSVFVFLKLFKFVKKFFCF